MVEYLREIDVEKTYGLIGSKYISGKFKAVTELDSLSEWQKEAMNQGISKELYGKRKK